MIIYCAFYGGAVTPHKLNRFTFYCPGCDKPIFPWHTEIVIDGKACPWPTPTQEGLRNCIGLRDSYELTKTKGNPMKKLTLEIPDHAVDEVAAILNKHAVARDYETHFGPNIAGLIDAAIEWAKDGIDPEVPYSHAHIVGCMGGYDRLYREDRNHRRGRAANHGDGASERRKGGTFERRALLRRERQW